MPVWSLGKGEVNTCERLNPMTLPKPASSPLPKVKVMKKKLFPLFILLYAISGFCILSMETIWIRDMGLHTGNTLLSASWIIAVFFICAGIGNRVSHKLLKKTNKPAFHKV